jgi:hypothetical protein
MQDPIPTQQRRFRDRCGATDFLRAQGLKLSENTLAELASDGRGPRYALILHRALYLDHDLLTWVEEQVQKDPRKCPRGTSR